MKKYTEIEIMYTSPCFPPDNVKLNSVYSIIKVDKELSIQSGEKAIPMEESLIKMLFTPKDCKWEEVDFIDTIRVEVKSNSK